MKLEEFVHALNAKFETTRFTIAPRGRKFKKILEEGHGAYCFVDSAGNIYKPETFHKPAPGRRDTLRTVKMEYVDPYGSWLYKENAAKRGF